MWEDVDFVEGTISIRRQVQHDPQEKAWELTAPKYDSFRTITVDNVLLALLKDEFQRQQRAREYYGQRYQQVCVNERGYLGSTGKPVYLINTREDGTFIQPRSLQHTNHVAHKELNMPLFDFHTLRHTHTTLLLEAGQTRWMCRSASVIPISQSPGDTPTTPPQSAARLLISCQRYSLDFTPRLCPFVYTFVDMRVDKIWTNAHFSTKKELSHF